MPLSAQLKKSPISDQQEVDVLSEATRHSSFAEPALPLLLLSMCPCGQENVNWFIFLIYSPHILLIYVQIAYLASVTTEILQLS